jgi:hypothetical protein
MSDSLDSFRLRSLGYYALMALVDENHPWRNERNGRWFGRIDGRVVAKIRKRIALCSRFMTPSDSGLFGWPNALRAICLAVEAELLGEDRSLALAAGALAIRRTAKIVDGSSEAKMYKREIYSAIEKRELALAIEKTP